MGSEIGAFLLGALFAFVIGAALGFDQEARSWEQNMIDRELAIYCPTDGEFAFIEDGCEQ